MRTYNLKRINKIIAIYLSIIMLLPTFFPIYAVESGDTENIQTIAETQSVESWGAETISSSTTKKISGTVNLNGTITVAAGVTLTIELADGVTSDVMIKRNFGTANAHANMFNLLDGSKLIIKGNNSYSIILDGGNTFSLTPESNNENVTTGINYSGCAINVKNASLEVTNVTIQNMFAHGNTSTALASAIKASGTTDSSHNITLTNTTIKNCLNRNDDAVLRLKGYVKMTNCDFINCSTNSKYGSIIKAGGGNVFCQLDMIDCYATGNYSSGWGGALLWAAAGRVSVNGETKSAYANLSNCVFENNTARYLGGAISSEATMTLTNCTIENNTAMAGGGVATFPFTLNDTISGDVAEACGLILGEGNIISNNIATASGKFIPEITVTTSNPNGTEFPAGGGGIWCFMNKEDWICTLDIGEGNTISNNKTNGTGGGVIVYKEIGGETKLIVSGAEINSNEASMGGGVALHSAEIEITGGTISSNVAGSGGGVFIAGGDVTITDGEISNNETTSGSGGGVYATSSEKDITVNITGGSIINNVSVSHAGAFGVNMENNHNVTVNLGLEECKGYEKYLHDSENCPLIEGNWSTEEGGGFCFHGNDTVFNMYCGTITKNIAINDQASNNMNITDGTINKFGGEIVGAISITGGSFIDDNNTTLYTVTYHSNYDTDVTKTPQVSEGTVIALSRHIFTRDGYYLVGWKTSKDSQKILYVDSIYTIENDIDFYAVWSTEEPIPSYTVYIPDSLEFNNNDTYGNIVISAELSFFTNLESIDIIINGIEELILEDNNNIQLMYEMENSLTNEVINNGDSVAVFTIDDLEDKEVIINVIDEPLYAGNYNDILTFSVNYNENVQREV